MFTFFSRVPRVLKKIARGDSIIIVRQSIEKWNAQFARGKWRLSEDLGKNVGVIAQHIVNHAAGRNIRVLDVGCGSGALAGHLRGHPLITYTGVDLSENALAQARERAPECSFLQHDMEKEPTFSGPFDVIVFAEVLLYVDAQRVLMLHKDLLASDGVLIISLYQSWRTRAVWQHIARTISVHNDVVVRDVTRAISWRVRLCSYAK